MCFVLTFERSVRSLAHLYHYYLHGEQGNTPGSERNQDLPSIQLECLAGKAPFWQCSLSEVDNDLESLYLRVSPALENGNACSWSTIAPLAAGVEFN